MSTPIFIHGLGAVSPAGWGLPALRAAIARNEPLPSRALARPGWEKPHRWPDFQVVIDHASRL